MASPDCKVPKWKRKLIPKDRVYHGKRNRC